MTSNHTHFSTPRGRMRAALALAALAALAAVTGCASVTTARVALPGGWTATETVAFEGVGGARRLTVSVGGLSARVERSADRVTLFDRADIDRAALRLVVTPDPGPARSLACRARRTTLTLGVGSPQPLELRCQAEDGSPRLQLDESREAAGTRVVHQGRWTQGAQALQIGSLHRLAGAGWLSPEPVGYRLADPQGRVLAILDLAGGTPRVVWPAGGPDSPWREAVLEASLVLALWWDPARAG
jgi:hypothetical protein